MDFNKAFRIRPGKAFHLSDIDPDMRDPKLDKHSARPLLADQQVRLTQLQYRLYAEGQQSLLICLQGMDASGKDGTIRHVFGALNPQGCRVQAFRQPTAHELAHDFLWRIHRATPGKAEVVIFNRSHYEDVLVSAVHGQVDGKTRKYRYQAINAFEEQLAENGTRILKFFLHIDKAEQLRRFARRLDDPSRHWKISEADYSERPFWDDYQRYYEKALNHCSTPHAPWFVIPANHKWFRNLAISGILLQTLEDMDPRLPAPKVDIEAIRQRFHEASSER